MAGHDTIKKIMNQPSFKPKIMLRDLLEKNETRPVPTSCRNAMNKPTKKLELAPQKAARCAIIKQKSANLKVCQNLKTP